MLLLLIFKKEQLFSVSFLLMLCTGGIKNQQESIAEKSVMSFFSHPDFLFFFRCLSKVRVSSKKQNCRTKIKIAVSSACNGSCYICNILCSVCPVVDRAFLEILPDLKTIREEKMKE